jgi:NAD(P)-dependent dehydrogenase (short-subunit alcohol dehydrogenase family)
VFGLQGKTAIVTGGSSGIGAAIVARFADEGATVFSLDIQQPTADRPDTWHVPCDVRSLQAVAAAVARVEQAAPSIDIVVANAGVHVPGSVADVDLDGFDMSLAVNVKGVFHTLRSVWPALQRQRAGVVTIMGSDQALIGKRDSAIYAATKGAVAQLAKCTALDWAPFNVRVNCVCPGAVETPAFASGVADFGRQYPGGRERILRGAVLGKVPLRRLGRPEEVAGLVAFLSSAEAAYITGALVSIDGGYVAQ